MLPHHVRYVKMPFTYFFFYNNLVCIFSVGASGSRDLAKDLNKQANKMFTQRNAVEDEKIKVNLVFYHLCIH